MNSSPISRVLITGHTGQLGRALHRRVPDAYGVSRPKVDIADSASFRAAVSQYRPELILHCAAYTDVDGAARDPALAFQVNGLGTQNAAVAAEACGAALAYISTNEIFDGEQAEPYLEFDSPNPLNPYARSKLAGEWYASHLCSRFYIIRTAWLYSAGGNNFLHTIQRKADQDGRLRVVADEIATPTWVEDLAEAVVKMVQTGRYGIYHLTNSGWCSRLTFARKVLELTGRQAVPIEPITRADFARLSKVPAFTALANTAAAALGVTLRPWEEALEEFLRVP